MDKNGPIDWDLLFGLSKFSDNVLGKTLNPSCIKSFF